MGEKKRRSRVHKKNLLLAYTQKRMFNFLFAFYFFSFHFIFFFFLCWFPNFLNRRRRWGLRLQASHIPIDSLPPSDPQMKRCCWYHRYCFVCSLVVVVVEHWASCGTDWASLSRAAGIGPPSQATRYQYHQVLGSTSSGGVG